MPLRYLASRSSKHSNNARLQIAAIELRNNNDPQAAVRALQELRLPLSSQVASAKEKIFRAANTRFHQHRAQATDPTS
ncbi:hypothetical protein RRSWK_06322 [Rhodopirellula sp. SWK7]|nr:hypothetical protein RRSWK_06322 [Rhodopirellula sp. SWK7]